MLRECRTASDAKRTGSNAKYVISENDVEEYQVLVECLVGLYENEDEEAANAFRQKAAEFLKKKVEELDARVKGTQDIRRIQELNLKAVNSIYHFAFYNTIGFVEKHIDKRISMILRMVYNSLSSSFQGMSDLFGDLAKSGTYHRIIEESTLKQSASKVRSELDEIISRGKENRGALGFEKEYEANVTRQIKDDFESLNNPRETSFVPGSDFQLSFLHEPLHTGLEEEGVLGLADIQKRLNVEPKKMSFIHMNEMIDELVQSKSKTDVKNLDSHLPRRTMEAHLHEVFKTKFGIKKLISENLISFLYTLKVYSSSDTRPKVFLSILRNETEEEFFQAINTIESSLCDLLKVNNLLTKMQIYSSFPLKAESEVNSELKAKIKGYLTLEEAFSLIEYLYCKEDADAIKSEIERNSGNEEERKDIGTREEKIIEERRTARSVILFREFRRITTDFLFNCHIEYLGPFVKIFKMFDQDQNGVLNEVKRV